MQWKIYVGPQNAFLSVKSFFYYFLEIASKQFILLFKNNKAVLSATRLVFMKKDDKYK
jgi:hypothetical protein